MTGAVTVAAVVGLLSLLSGVALGWHLRQANNRCRDCGDDLTCISCEAHAIWSRSAATASSGS
jgi:hypothetical protein